MSIPSSRLDVAGAVLVLLALTGGAVQTATSKEIAYTKDVRQTISETKADPGYPTTGELAQQIFLDTVTAPPTDFPIIQIRVYNQDNTVAGNGVHRGYEVQVFRNGDSAYTKYEGTHKVITKEDGGWEVTYEGTQSYLGGTGTYKDIRGEGTYRGMITPDSFQEENKWNLSY